MTRRRVIAAVPFAIVAIASLVRSHGIYAGDFSPAWTHDSWLTWRSQQLWGVGWAALGVGTAAVAACTVAGGRWAHRVRVAVALFALLYLVGWSYLIYWGSDWSNTTMWVFLAYATMIGWYWGLDPVRATPDD